MQLRLTPRWRRSTLCTTTAYSAAQQGQASPLGSAPARLLQLIRARLVAPSGPQCPGESVPLGDQPLPRVLELAPPFTKQVTRVLCRTPTTSRCPSAPRRSARATVPPHGQECAPLSSASAQFLRRPKAHLTALGSSALPRRGSATDIAAMASDARATPPPKMPISPHLTYQCRCCRAGHRRCRPPCDYRLDGADRWAHLHH